MKCFIVLALAFASANASGLALGGYGAAPALCGGVYNGYSGTSDPTVFVQCSNGIPNLQKCAPGTVWNQPSLTCENGAYGAPIAAAPYGAAAAIAAPYGGPAAIAAPYGAAAAIAAPYGASAGYAANPCAGAYDALVGAEGAGSYTQCSNGIPVQQKCPYGTGWSNYTKRCE